MSLKSSGSLPCVKQLLPPNDYLNRQETPMSLRRWKDRMVAHLLTRYPELVKRWSGNRDFSVVKAEGVLIYRIPTDAMTSHFDQRYRV